MQKLPIVFCAHSLEATGNLSEVSHKIARPEHKTNKEEEKKPPKNANARRDDFMYNISLRHITVQGTEITRECKSDIVFTVHEAKCAHNKLLDKEETATNNLYRNHL